MDSHFPSSACFAGDGALILWGNINPTQTNEDDLNDWWTNEHLPERLRLPGFIRARRFHAHETNSATSNSHGYLAFYEVSEVNDLASPEYMFALNNPTPRTKKFMPCLAGMTRCSCEVLGSWSCADSDQKKRGMVALGVFDRQNDEVVERRWEETLPALVAGLGQTMEETKDKGLVAMHLAKENEDISRSGSSSKSYDGVGFSPRLENNARAGKTHIVVLEFEEKPAAEGYKSMKGTIGDVRALVERCGGNEMAWETYEFICSMEKDDISTNEEK